MKKLVTSLFLGLIVALGVQAQEIKKVFDKYGDDERFTYVSVGKGAMNMAKSFSANYVGNSEMQIIEKMNGVRVLTLEGGNEKIAKSFTNDIDKVIKSGNYEEIVNVRDKGERVNIYTQVDKENNAEMLIITKDSDEVSLIWITGKASKEEMSKIMSN